MAQVHATPSTPAVSHRASAAQPLSMEEKVIRWLALNHENFSTSPTALVAEGVKEIVKLAGILELKLPEKSYPADYLKGILEKLETASLPLKPSVKQTLKEVMQIASFNHCKSEALEGTTNLNQRLNRMTVCKTNHFPSFVLLAGGDRCGLLKERLARNGIGQNKIGFLSPEVQGKAQASLKAEEEELRAEMKKESCK